MAVGAGEPRHPPDLRLVPGALAAWAVVLLGIGFGPLVASVAVLLAGAAAAAAHRRHWRPAVLAVAGCAGAAGLVVTAQTALLVLHPLRAPAERGASATVRVLVADDPRAVRGSGYGSRPAATAQVVVRATLVGAEVDDGRWSAGGRVLLIAPVQGWEGLLPGQAVTAEGLLAPAGRTDLTVAVLRVRGPPREIGPPPWWQQAAGGLRTGLRTAAEVLPPASAGLLPGLAVGDTSGLTAEVEADFRAAGLTHLLAVSGVTARQTGVYADARGYHVRTPTSRAVWAGVEDRAQ